MVEAAGIEPASNTSSWASGSGKNFHEYKQEENSRWNLYELRLVYRRRFCQSGNLWNKPSNHKRLEASNSRR